MGNQARQRAGSSHSPPCGQVQQIKPICADGNVISLEKESGVKVNVLPMKSGNRSL